MSFVLTEVSCEVNYPILLFEHGTRHLDPSLAFRALSLYGPQVDRAGDHIDPFIGGPLRPHVEAVGQDP